MTTVVILAGGESRRMGEDKRRLRLFPASPTFLERVVALGRLIGEHVAVVGDEIGADGLGELVAVPDGWPGEGPLGGLVTALDRFPEDRLIVLACDYPMLQLRVASRLVDLLPGHDAALPRAGNGRSHPLVGCYDAPRCRPIAREAFDAGERSMSALVARLDVAWLQVGAEDALSLANVNDADGLAGLRSHAIEMDERGRWVTGQAIPMAP